MIFWAKKQSVNKRCSVIYCMILALFGGVFGGQDVGCLHLDLSAGSECPENAPGEHSRCLAPLRSACWCLVTLMTVDCSGCSPCYVCEC